MPRKLSIVISGAVSLGSYEAGVIYELMEAIALHNKSLQETSVELYKEKRVLIDVITGASAGAMTAGILSQQLYYGGKQLREAYGNPLFNAWVKKISIDKLLNLEKEKQIYSLLSSDVIDEIGVSYIQDNPGDILDRHPAASDNLRIGLAMSNLNGFPREFVCQLTLPQSKDELSISSIYYKDRGIQLFEMEPHWDRKKVSWKPMAQSCNWQILRMMALSSGAFPFAFRARRIVRIGGSEDSLTRSRDSRRKATAGDKLHRGDYLYTDGGIFENEPVGMAANLSKDIDEKDGDSNRIYLFVAPGKRKIDADPFFNKEDDLLGMTLALASAIFGQSRFQQWVTEGLDNDLLTVTASDNILIGDIYSAFGGFLEEGFRTYDYNIGRRVTRQQLREGKFISLIDNFNGIDQKMPMIDWPKDTQPIRPQSTHLHVRADNPFVNEKIQDGYREYETDSWKRVRDDLILLAQPYFTEENGLKKRQPMSELRRLMERVGMNRRELIAAQIYARIDSLVDLFSDNYIDKVDSRRRFQQFRKLLRQIMGKPLAKFVLKRLMRPFLESNVLRPGPIDARDYKDH